MGLDDLMSCHSIDDSSSPHMAPANNMYDIAASTLSTLFNQDSNVDTKTHPPDFDNNTRSIPHHKARQCCYGHTHQKDAMKVEEKVISCIMAQTIAIFAHLIDTWPIHLRTKGVLSRSEEVTTVDHHRHIDGRWPQSSTITNATRLVIDENGNVFVRLTPSGLKRYTSGRFISRRKFLYWSILLLAFSPILIRLSIDG
jgi:hypothetical protein